ncbi:hypothetical protein GF420_12805, partial [candidate division GN15 bacterium]|nr:hypothetical protein [candidate division GN15 bacterium]
MSQDKALTRKKLTALWRSGSTPVLPTRTRKYVLLSDVHLGDKGEADDFRAN